MHGPLGPDIAMMDRRGVVRTSITMLAAGVVAVTAFLGSLHRMWWEVIVGAAFAGLLVGSYLLRQWARSKTIYRDDRKRPPDGGAGDGSDPAHWED